jgi:hypothetical protein
MEDGWLADHWTELRACRAPKDPWLCLDVTGHVPEDIASSSLFDDPPSFMVKAIRARSLEADDPIRTVFKNKTSLCNLMTRGYQGSVQSCSMALGEFLQDDKRPSESVSITIMDGLLNGHRLAMAHADDIFRHRDRLHQGIVYEASQDDHRLMRYASSAHAAPHSRIPWGCWTPEQRSEVWSMMADDERIGTWTTCHLKSLIRMVHDNDTAMPIHAWLSEDPERVRMLLDRGIPPGIIVTWAMHADAPDPSVLAVIQSSDTDGSSS